VDLGFSASAPRATIDECKRIEEDNAEFHLAPFGSPLFSMATLRY